MLEQTYQRAQESFGQGTHPPLWGVAKEGGTENLQQTKELTAQVRRLRETMREMPNKLAEQMKSRANTPEAAGSTGRTQEKKAEARLDDRFEDLRDSVANDNAKSLGDVVKQVSKGTSQAPRVNTSVNNKEVGSPPAAPAPDASSRRSDAAPATTNKPPEDKDKAA